MVQKVYEGISSKAEPCNSKRPTDKAVRVVQISNPTMVKTSASEFRAVVQSLTGRKRSSAFGNQHEEINLYSGDQYSSQVEVPKIKNGLQNLNDRKTSLSAVIHDNATGSNCYNDKDHGDFRILEDLEVQPIQNPHYFPSQYQVFDILENIS